MFPKPIPQNTKFLAANKRSQTVASLLPGKVEEDEDSETRCGLWKEVKTVSRREEKRHSRNTVTTYTTKMLLS